VGHVQDIPQLSGDLHDLAAQVHAGNNEDLIHKHIRSMTFPAP